MNTSLIVFALIPSLALASAAEPPSADATARPLPDFVKKVQLQNCGGAEATEDGKGVRLYRIPKSVRDHLTEGNNPDGGGKTGAEVMTAARHSEIRFVVKEGEKKKM